MPWSAKIVARRGHTRVAYAMSAAFDIGLHYTDGKAHALLALGRADQALAEFDRARAAAPGNLEALEGRAIALRELGRDAEANDELGRVIAASGVRSELGVRRWKS